MKKEKKKSTLGNEPAQWMRVMKNQRFLERNFLSDSSAWLWRKMLHTGSFIETSLSVLIFLNPEGARDRQGSRPFFLHILQQTSDSSSHNLIKSKVLVPCKWLIKGKDDPSFETFPSAQSENPTLENEKCTPVRLIRAKCLVHTVKDLGKTMPAWGIIDSSLKSRQKRLYLHGLSRTCLSMELKGPTCIVSSKYLMD